MSTEEPHFRTALVLYLNQTPLAADISVPPNTSGVRFGFGFPLHDSFLREQMRDNNAVVQRVTNLLKRVLATLFMIVLGVPSPFSNQDRLQSSTSLQGWAKSRQVVLKRQVSPFSATRQGLPVQKAKGCSGASLTEPALWKMGKQII